MCFCKGRLVHLALHVESDTEEIEDDEIVAGTSLPSLAVPLEII